MTRTNSKKKRVDEDGEDRISNLPDPILHQILSLVNIKTAVQSCILSKRWRYVWNSLPNLDFNYHKFPFCCLQCKCTKCYKHKVPCFTNFVNQVLSLRDNSNVLEFRYSSPNYLDPSFINRCISYAVSHSARKLCVQGSYYPVPPIEFPSCFFTCKSLTVLELRHFYWNLRLPKSFSMPAVKALYLESFVEDKNLGFTGEIFANFPKLESLVLCDCLLKNVNISVPLLKSLEILFKPCGYSFNGGTITVSVPRLTSFRFEGHVSFVLRSMDDLPCLENVSIDLHPRFLPPDIDYVKERIPLKLIETLECLRNAKSIALSLDTVKVLEMDPSSLNGRPSPFCALKHLKLIAPTKDTTILLPHNVMTYLTKGSPRVTIHFGIP